MRTLLDHADLVVDSSAALRIAATEQILAFERHYNATARPFDWRSTKADLNKVLTRIGRHDPFAPQPLAA